MGVIIVEKNSTINLTFTRVNPEGKEEICQATVTMIPGEGHQVLEFSEEQKKELTKIFSELFSSVDLGKSAAKDV